MYRNGVNVFPENVDVVTAIIDLENVLAPFVPCVCAFNALLAIGLVIVMLLPEMLELQPDAHEDPL